MGAEILLGLKAGNVYVNAVSQLVNEARSSTRSDVILWKLFTLPEPRVG
jgi:hypothetical protein